MSILTRKPTEIQDITPKGKYDLFNLKENPFPSEPTVNKESTDKRINGGIYEMQIRNNEFELIKNHFLIQPQKNPNHLRLGYIIDSSYIGRGNGKSAFLIFLLHSINRNFCLDFSNNKNKCFATYVAPEPGGRTKTFSSFVDCIFDSIINSNIISISLATIKLEIINSIYPQFDVSKFDDQQLIENLNDKEWLENNHLNYAVIQKELYKNPFFQDLPSEFPIFLGRNNFLPQFITQDDFSNYYKFLIKKPKEKIDFIFSHLIKLFLAANFNGAYILVDDFERIPDFQSTRQKKDFALELRSSLFDGFNLNAKLGFYNFLLVLHAGVPRLISDAWAGSGLENRAPINQTAYKHIILFEKLNKDHAILLLQKYLSEYRIDQSKEKNIEPFNEKAVVKIGEFSEYNAAKILKMAYELLEKAAENNQHIIDETFVVENRGNWELNVNDKPPSIDTAKTTDLMEKASPEQ